MAIHELNNYFKFSYPNINFTFKEYLILISLFSYDEKS
jgi:hypothetical protein